MAPRSSSEMKRKPPKRGRKGADLFAAFNGSCATLREPGEPGMIC